jgi:hypothetical protein
MISLKKMAGDNPSRPTHLTHIKIPITTIITSPKTGTKHPSIDPILRCLPDLVKGMPILRDSLDFAAEIPRNLFQENPPRFMRWVPVKGFLD